MTIPVIRPSRYRLTTAEITYHLPDYPHILQNYIWQDFDLTPDYPVLKRFLRFWQRNLEGKLHTVRIAARSLVGPIDIRTASDWLTLH